MSSQTWTVVLEREYAVDPDELRRDFGRELREDGVDLSDDAAVVRHCWDEQVGASYFELQDEDIHNAELET